MASRRSSAPFVRGGPAQDTRPIEALFAPRFDEFSRGLLEIAKKQDQGDKRMADMAIELHSTAQEVVTIQKDIVSRHHQVSAMMERTHDRILDHNRVVMEETKAAFRAEMQTLLQDSADTHTSTSAAIDRLSSQAADTATTQASFIHEATGARAEQTSALQAIAARLAASQLTINSTAAEVQALGVRADEHEEELAGFRPHHNKKKRGANHSPTDQLVCLDTPLHGAGASRADNVSTTESGHSNGEEPPRDLDMTPG